MDSAEEEKVLRTIRHQEERETSLPHDKQAEIGHRYFMIPMGLMMSGDRNGLGEEGGRKSDRGNEISY